MSRSPAKPVSMAAVTIGFQTVLLPTDKALKLLDLLQHAVMCEMDYSTRHDGYVYYPSGPARVELKMVKPDQIVAKPTPTHQPRGPALIEGG